MGKPQFVVVAAAPRTGSSLVCDMVNRLGFNFGACDNKAEDPRHGRWESGWVNMDLSSPDVPTESILQAMAEQGISAMKLGVRIVSWLPFLRERYSLRVLYCARDFTQAAASFEQYAEVDERMHIPKDLRPLRWWQAKAAVDVAVLESGMPYCRVDFGKLIEGDGDMLGEMVGFLEMQPDAYTLARLRALIRPDIVRFGGKG